MKTSELSKNRGWDRADLDAVKLAKLAWSMKVGGWAAGHPVTYETLGDGHKEILWGHRRTLAAVLAVGSADEHRNVQDIDEMVAYIEGLVVRTVERDVCPSCGEAVDRQGSRWCQNCREILYKDDYDGTVPTWLGVIGPVEEFDISILIKDYNEIIQTADVDVPAEEIAYHSDLFSQLSLIGDGLGREDSDVLGLAAAIARAHELGGTKAEIGKLGLTDNEVQAYLAINVLPPKIGLLIASGQLALSVPRIIAKLSDANQRAAVCKMVYNQTTVSAVESYVKKLKEYKIPAQDMFASQYANNVAAVEAYVVTEALESDPENFWYNFLSRARTIVPEDIATLVPQVSCENCPLKGKLKDLPEIHTSTSGGYQCQKNLDATWCYLAGPEVYADYRVNETADREYPRLKFFSTFELAKEAYDSLEMESVTETAGEEGVQRPIDKQRVRIRQFIEDQAAANGRDHPLATVCEECSFRTEASPVKSAPDAPHCAWAGKRTNIYMGFLVDEKGYTIPNCLQYAPLADFSSMIPETDCGAMQPVIINHVLNTLVAKLENVSTPPLRRLTGVPFSAQEHSTDWFRKKLEEVPLSPEQQVTLIGWLMAEIDRGRGNPAMIQLTQGRMGSFEKCLTLKK